MFDALSGKLNSIIKNVTGRGKLSDENVQEALREVKMALLEADVNYKVVRGFLEKVKERALGVEVHQSLNPGQQFIKIVQDELTDLMGSTDSKVQLASTPPTVIMMVGLQGAGKTTTVG